MNPKPKIAFQGEPGANSDEACRAHFPDYEPAPNATFEDAFEAVKSGDCALGMIPVENSIAGRVADVHHLLPSSGLKIIGERFKPIRFQLMANPGTLLEDVITVISMPFAAGQCRKALRRLGAVIEPAGDTAGSAKALVARPRSNQGGHSAGLGRPDLWPRYPHDRYRRRGAQHHALPGHVGRPDSARTSGWRGVHNQLCLPCAQHPGGAL